MATNRIAWRSPTPTTDFYLDADVIAVEGPGTTSTYGRWLVRSYLTAVNRGNTSSYDGNAGSQNGYINGYQFGAHNGHPFLPSGVGTNVQRWKDGPWDVWIYANERGYVSGTSLTMTSGQYVACSSFSNSQDAYWTVSRIAQVPSAPTPLGLDEITPTTMRYRFNGNDNGGSGIIRWEYQYSTSSNFSSGNSALFTSTGTSTVTGLNPRTKYYFRSRGVNAVGNGAWSSIVNATTIGETVPSAPSGYSATDIAATSAYSSMPSVADNGGLPLTDIRIEWNTVASSAGSTIAAVGEYSAPFLHSLITGTTYHYRLAVANALGWGAWGAWVSFTTRSNVPTEPTSFAASLIDDVDATLSWGAPALLNGTSILSYTLRVATNRSFSAGLQSFTLTAAEFSQLVEGLTPSTKYYAQVWSNSPNGFGSYSQIISFTTDGLSTVGHVWLRIAGVWRRGVLWINDGGVWKKATLWQRITGIWRKSA